MKKKNFKDNKKGNKWKKFETKSKEDKGVAPNSPEWYYPSPEIQKLAAAISMNNRNGDKIEFADGTNLTEVSTAINRMPGVYVNPVLHVPGIATAPNDSLNEAARAVMSRIRETINATRSYEMPDLIKYLISIIHINAWVEFLKLVYSICNKYNVLNRYTPTVLLRALHIDTSNINDLRIQLAFYINNLVLRIRNLKVPTDIPLTLTWIEDFKHVYVDEDIAKAQYIINAPMYIWKYYIDPNTGKSKLIPKEYFRAFSATPATVQDLINFTEDLLAPIINDEDFAIMTGDIMKSYSSFYEQSELDVNSVIDFDYSPEFLEKWHNSAQFQTYQAQDYGLTTVSDWEIVEDASPNLDPFIVFDPKFTAASASVFTAEKRGAGNRYLDFYDNEVTTDQIINGCLWMFTFKIDDAANFKYSFKTVNTSLVGGGEIWYFDSQGVIKTAGFDGGFTFNINSSNQGVTPMTSLETIILLSKWNYCPMTIFVVLANALSGTDIGYYGVLGDLGNYAVVDARILKNVSTCILYGQYNINYLLRG